MLGTLLRRPAARPVFATAATIVASALCAGARAAVAQAPENAIYVVANNTTLSIVTNQATGAIATVAGGTLSFGTSAAARDPLTGRIYYLATNTATPVGRVSYWDPATQTNTAVNTTGSPGLDNVVRAAFNSAGVLYGLGSAGVLYTIATTSPGAYTAVGTGAVRVTNVTGTPIIGASGDMAFGPTGTLWVIAQCVGLGFVAGDYCLSTIDVAAAPSPTATQIGKVTNTGSTIASLGFGIGGVLYAGAANGVYYTINTATPSASTSQTNAGAVYYDFASTPRFADLQISKTDSPDPVNASGTLTYTIVVTNAGPHSSTAVQVSDPLPAGTLFQSVTAPFGFSCTTPAVNANGTVTCTLGAGGSLASGASVTFTIVVKAPAAAATLTNTATVSSGTIDPTPANNSATQATTVIVAPDLTVTKSHAAAFIAGRQGVYTIAASNAGGAATSATITVLDTLPAGLTYATGSGAGWTCSAAGQVVTCTTPGPIAAGAAAAAISLTVNVTAAAAPSVTNRARVSGGGEPAANNGNNVSSDVTAVTVAAVTVTPDGATVDRLPSNGTQYSQVFTVTNNGNASDVLNLAATLAPGGTLAVVSVNGTAGTTSSVTLAAGASASVTVVYTVGNQPAGTTDKLTLTATSTTNNTVNDPGDLTVRVIKAALTMTKQAYRDDQTTLITGAAKVQPTEFVQYKITVTNNGLAAATVTHATDALPAQVTYVSAAGDAAGWTIGQSAGTVTADLAGTLAAGASRFFWIRARVK